VVTTVATATVAAMRRINFSVFGRDDR